MRDDGVLSEVELFAHGTFAVLVGGWLLQRWARKLLYPQPTLTPLVRLQARWPGFGRTELERFLTAHGGDAQAAGNEMQRQVLSGELSTLIDVEVQKDGSARLGCVLSGQPSQLASVAEVVPGGLVYGGLRVGDTICRVNGEVAADVQAAQRLMVEATGVVRLQVHRGPAPAEPAERAKRAGTTGSELDGEARAEAVRGTLRQRAAPG